MEGIRAAQLQVELHALNHLGQEVASRLLADLPPRLLVTWSER